MVCIPSPFQIYLQRNGTFNWLAWITLCGSDKRRAGWKAKTVDRVGLRISDSRNFCICLISQVDHKTFLLCIIMDIPFVFFVLRIHRQQHFGIISSFRFSHRGFFQLLAWQTVHRKKYVSWHLLFWFVQGCTGIACRISNYYANEVVQRDVIYHI